MRLSLTALVTVSILAMLGCTRQASQPAASPTVSPAASATVVSTTSSPEKLLTRQELQDIFNAFGTLNGVELKMTIDDSDRQSVVKALDIDPLEAELRQVIFFDTSDLALNRAGVVVRARRKHDDDGDSVIKLRPVSPPQVPPRLRSIPTFKVELDVMPERYVCSASFEREDIDDKDIKAVLAKRKPIQDLFSPDERAFYSEHAPKGVSLDSLRVLHAHQVAIREAAKIDAAGLHQILLDRPDAVVIVFKVIKTIKFATKTARRTCQQGALQRTAVR